MNKLFKISLRKLAIWFPVLQRFYLYYMHMKHDSTIAHKIKDQALVYFHNRNGLHLLNGSNKKEVARPLPSQLILERGVYSFCNLVFDCNVPGVYRFVYPQQINRQYVVLDNNDPLTSVLYMTLLSIRGNRDDFQPQQQLERLVIRRFLSLTCGPNSLFLMRLLAPQGYKVRVVYSHTYEELNSYNNGHTLLEIYSEVFKKFVVVDVDKKCMYRLDGNPLSLYEYSKALFERRLIQVDMISRTTMVDWQGFVEPSNGFHYGFIEQLHCELSTGKANYLSRICQVPLMVEGDSTFACAWNSKIESRLLEINNEWKILSPDDFLNRFYS